MNGNPGLNRMSADLMGPKNGGELKLTQEGTRLLVESLEARLEASEFDFFSEPIGSPTFLPDVDSSCFDPFNNDQFDAFHLSDLSGCKAADWTNDEAF